MPRTRKYSSTAFFAHSFTTHAAVRRAPRHGPLPVEQTDRVLDRVGVDVPVLGPEARLDPRGQLGVGVDAHACTSRPTARSRGSRRRGRNRRASPPSPSGRSPPPPVRRTTRARRPVRAPAARAPMSREGRPPGTATHRYMPATLPATSTPSRREQVAEYARASRRSATLLLARGPRRSRRRRRALDELLRRHPGRGAERLHRRDQPGVAGHEAGAVPRHVRALAERVEHDDVRAIGELQPRGRGPVSNHSSLYASSSASRNVVTARQVGGVLRKESGATAPVGLFGGHARGGRARSSSTSAWPAASAAATTRRRCCGRRPPPGTPARLARGGGDRAGRDRRPGHGRARGVRVAGATPTPRSRRSSSPRRAGDVKRVVCGGREIVRDGAHLGLDVAAELRSRSPR